MLPTLPAAVDKKSEVDSLILKYSILNGALELLSETLSTMAIIPLHLKLLPQIQEQAAGLDHRKVLAMLRGQS